MEMDALVKYITIISITLLISSVACAQEKHLTNDVGVHIGAGFSHLLFGNPFALTNTVAHPKLGGGMTVGLYYELAYKYFLFYTGIGMDYTVNSNMLSVEGFSSAIQEYPFMQYHYRFDKYIEATRYGSVYIPIQLGATFNQWYFLLGAKIGFMSFASKSNITTDVCIWATDDDVIGPIENLPNHGLQTYSLVNKSQKIELSPFNAMLSAEVGIKLNRGVWSSKRKGQLDRSDHYITTKREHPLKGLLQYRLSLFVDYGLSNIHSYTANPVAYNGQNSGGLIAQHSVIDLIPYSIFGFEKYKQSTLNNLFLGMKLSIQFRIPKNYPCRCIVYSD